MPPLARHLSSAGGRIDGSTNRLIQHLGWCNAELETQRAIAIVGIEPVVGRFEDHSGSGENCLVPCSGNLEENLVLTLELDFLVVEPPRQEHVPVSGNQLLW